MNSGWLVPGAIGGLFIAWLLLRFFRGRREQRHRENLRRRLYPRPPTRDTDRGCGE
jgi:hypothetical protein